MNRKSTLFVVLALAFGVALYGCQNNSSNPASVAADVQSAGHAFHKTTPIPSGLAVTVLGHSVTLTWSATNGVSTFTVVIRDSVTNAGIDSATVPSTTLLVNFAGVPSGSYYATVRADQGYESGRVFFGVSDVQVLPPVVTACASATVIWPPNHKKVSVTFTGVVTNSEGGATYSLADEYGKISYSGPLDAGPYTLKLKLQATRKGKDRDGRQYTFTVTATNSAGSDTASVVVVVPHDKDKKPKKNH